MSPMTIQEAIRDLRKTYDETQQRFATRLRMAMGSLAYYEIGARSPDLTATLKFEGAADAYGREDLTKIFARRAAAELEYFVVPADNEVQFEQLQKLREILKLGSSVQAPRNAAFAAVPIAVKVALAYQKLMDLLADIDEIKRAARRDLYGETPNERTQE
jgi:transcriptional regulator with XRE-family HTH domain